MVRVAFFLFVLLLPAGLAAAVPGETIDYRFRPVVGAEGLETLEITVAFAGDADGATEIVLPDSWAGTEALYEGIAAIEAEGGAIEPGEGPARRVVRHAPQAPLVLRYRLRASTEDPGPGYAKAQPVIRPGWFYIHGEGAIVIPAGREASPARFAWVGTPPGWTLASDVDRAGALSANKLGGAIYAGGTDLRLIEGEADGAPVRLVLRGEWSFSDAALFDALVRVIAAENRYMGDGGVAYFVSLIPLTGAETGALSSGGTGRTHGFALAATGNVGLDEFLRTIAHEYGHRWFGREFGPVPENGAVDYWFTEGFGDFVAGRALVRAGLWGPSDYARMLNALLLRYASSPARELDNAALAEAFWSDPAAMQMPYDRGHLFALLLDGHGGALRAALTRMAARPEDFRAEETQAARFIRAFGPDPQGLAAMQAGEPLILPEALFAPCGTIRWAEQPVYATGYTAASDEEGLYFDTVVEGSPAWIAGLRPGMRYLRRISFEPGNAAVPIVMRVGDAAGARVISWLPMGEAQVRFQRLVLADGAEEDARCRFRLRGG